MSWYDFRHDYANFDAYLPPGKNVTDLGYTYPELCCIGSWYFAPVKGTGQRRFYNRWYLDKAGTTIDDNLIAYIDCGTTKFGKLITKPPHDPFHELGWTDEKLETESVKMKEYLEYITQEVHRSWVVLVPDNRCDVGYMFDDYNNALEYAQFYYDRLTTYMKKTYGVEIYQPQNTVPIYILGGGE